MPDLVVPALGESITEAVISRWHKNVGDEVEADEPVLALETDKITVDLPAPSAGSLAEQKFAEGDTVRVGDVVGSISAGGEAKAAKPEAESKPAAKSESKPAAKSETKPAATAESKPEAKAEARPAARSETRPEAKAEAKPAAKPEAKAEAKPEAEAKPTAKAPATPTPSSPRSEAGNGQAGRRMSPSMRRAQREETTSPPAAPDPGAAAKAPTAAATPAAPPAGTAPARAKPQVEKGKADPREDVVPMTPIRKRIAQRLVEAQQSSASLTTFNEVDMSKVMELRDRYKQEFVERHGVKLGFMSFFARAAVAALAEFPGLNAEVRGEAIVYKKHYDLGIAVQTERGLMVPVLRDVDRLGFAEIEKGIGELAARGRAGKLALDDLVGATFTITNGGIFGSMLSTPLLNYPQTGILGMHNIVDRPVATGGTVHVRPIMYVALTYDHRVVDGREAVSFLVGIKQRIESPDRLLFDL